MPYTLLCMIVEKQIMIIFKYLKEEKAHKNINNNFPLYISNFRSQDNQIKQLSEIVSDHETKEGIQAPTIRNDIILVTMYQV